MQQHIDSSLLCEPDHGHNLCFCSLWQGLPVSTWKRSPAAAAVLARLLPIDSVPEYLPPAMVTDHAHKPFRYMYLVRILLNLALPPTSYVFLRHLTAV